MTQRARILFVDDDDKLLSAVKRVLRREFNIFTAEGAQAALNIIAKEKEFAVVVSDQNMPGIKGAEFLAKIAQQSPNTVRIMLTGNNDLETSMHAINEGKIFRFLTKPCGPEDFCQTLHDAIAQYELIQSERELLEKTLSGSVKLLMDVLAQSHPATSLKIERVRAWVKLIAPKLHLPRKWELSISAMLWPLGDITLPTGLIEKRENKAALSDSETHMLFQAPATARDLLVNIPRLDNVAQIVYYSQAGFDGSGFPNDGTKGKDLPEISRILKILIDLANAMETAPEGSLCEALQIIRLKSSSYDKAMFDFISEILLEHIQDDGAQETVVYKIGCERLMPGDILLGPIKNKDGKLLLAAGMEMTQAMIQKVRQVKMIDGISEPLEIRRVASNTDRIAS